VSPGKTTIVILLACAFLVGVGVLLDRAYPDGDGHGNS
jgi:hypothetical protein